MNACQVGEPAHWLPCWITSPHGDLLHIITGSGWLSSGTNGTKLLCLEARLPVLGSAVLSRVFLYVTQLIIKVSSIPVRLSCVTHPRRAMAQLSVAAELTTRNKWPLPTRDSAAQWGSHRGPQPQREFIPGFTPDPSFSISPLCLCLSLHFNLISLHLCDCLKLRCCYIKIASNICSIVCMWFLSPDSCKGDKILHHAAFSFWWWEVCFRHAACCLMMWRPVLRKQENKPAFVLRHDYSSWLRGVVLVVLVALDACRLLNSVNEDMIIFEIRLLIRLSREDVHESRTNATLSLSYLLVCLQCCLFLLCSCVDIVTSSTRTSTDLQFFCTVSVFDSPSNWLTTSFTHVADKMNSVHLSTSRCKLSTPKPT